MAFDTNSRELKPAATNETILEAQIAWEERPSSAHLPSAIRTKISILKAFPIAKSGTLWLQDAPRLPNLAPAKAFSTDYLSSISFDRPKQG